MQIVCKQWMSYQVLSDGQKTVMGIVADLIYRCTIFNPQFEENAAKETNGILLIDEIDIWQREIVGMLRTVFPKIQFIVTTHSPFIIQS